MTNVEQEVTLGPKYMRASLFFCALLVGCGSWEERRDEELRVLEGHRISGNEGFANIRLPLTNADKTMLLHVTAADGFLSHIERLEDADGNILHAFEEDIKRSKHRSSGAFASDFTLLNWPVSGEEALLTGEEVVAVVGASDDSGTLNSGVRLDLAAYMKADADLDEGELTVNLFFAGATVDDAEIRTAVEEAVELWRILYADAGLTINLEMKDWVEGNLPKPGEGAPGEYEALSAESALRSVNVVIVPTILESEELLGTAGGIPGPLVSSDRSAVLISAAANAGPDLDFDDLEVRLLAETLAHEAGHYLGLFHPVENSWDSWDALSDTEDCDDQQICEDTFKNNLMFPYPVCDGSTCEMQDGLTELQRSVLQRYTGVW